MRTDRVIGMVQPTRGGDADRPDVYPIGCAGRITSFAETDDGRYLITLTGVCRFELVKELPVGTPYRQVGASFERWQSDLEPPAPSDSLRAIAGRGAARLFRGLRDQRRLERRSRRHRSPA